MPTPDLDDFRAFSARLGQDPLRMQRPGGNTSLKDGGVMWIKASGTELAEAATRDILVRVDRAAALAEACEGSCKATVLDSWQTRYPTRSRRRSTRRWTGRSSPIPIPSQRWSMPSRRRERPPRGTD